MIRGSRLATRVLTLGVVVAGVSLVALAGCYDTTHDDEVAALGPEDPSVPQGPLHRAGQPCCVCHGGAGPAGQVFSLAGTVYTYGFDPTDPANGATVQVQDATGSAWHVATNQAGNFFVLKSDWSPTFPVTVPSVSQGGTSQPMLTLDNRANSCATCHSLQAGPESVGPIYINERKPDGGV